MIFLIYAVFFAGFVAIAVLYAVTGKIKKEPLSDDALAAKANIAVYKKQLQEIEIDLKQGFIEQNSAEEARLEIARSLLKMQKNIPPMPNNRQRSRFMQIILTGAILFIPVIILLLHFFLGNPNVQSYPFQTLLDKPVAKRNAQEKLVATEALFMRNPNDGKLADQLASQYLIMGQFQNAVNSYVDALRLNGENAPRLVGYGLALKGFEGGVITKDAQNAFEQAAKIAPDDYYPQLYIAEALEQAGENAKAIKRLQDFLQIAPNNSPQTARLRQRLEMMIEQLQKDTKLHNETNINNTLN